MLYVTTATPISWSHRWQPEGSRVCLALLCIGNEEACASNAGGPSVKVNWTGEVSSSRSGGLSSSIVSLGICVESLRPTRIPDSDDSLFSPSTVLSHSEDLPSWFIPLTEWRSIIWHDIPLTRTKSSHGVQSPSTFQIETDDAWGLHPHFVRCILLACQVELQCLSLLTALGRCRSHLPDLWRLMYCSLALYCSNTLLLLQNTAFWC